MGGRSVWQAEFLAKNSHLRPAMDREEAARFGEASGAEPCMCDTAFTCMAAEADHCTDNGSR